MAGNICLPETTVNILRSFNDASANSHGHVVRRQRIPRRALELGDGFVPSRSERGARCRGRSSARSGVQCHVFRLAVEQATA